MRLFLCVSALLTASMVARGAEPDATDDPARPNILFCIADDWGWPHAGAYGDVVVKTPTFDQLAREGVLFEQAYISSPSCTPSRGAILTGQFHWRLGGAGNLWSVFPDRFPTYPEVLSAAGYHVGKTGKAWGPGVPATKSRPLAGENYQSFAAFMEQRPEGQPFCFWLGSSDPHRPYKAGSGAANGIPVADVQVPPCFPDAEVIRSDIADYYFEVQRFDALVGKTLQLLDQLGETNQTIVVMTGDHGWPFPRGKSNLYDLGARVPLAIRWPAQAPGDRTVTDFVSLTDLAPTFLEIASLPADEAMTGRSLMPLLRDDRQGRVTTQRDFVVFGKERHVPGQESPDLGGYPSRAIRTDEWLLIYNLTPNRWPNGTPNYQQATIDDAWYADTDNGPTKSYIIANRDRDEQHRQSYELCFAKRPELELYDLTSDPDQLRDVADVAANQDDMTRLLAQLQAILTETQDPRMVNEGLTFDGITFDDYPYLGGAPKYQPFDSKQ